MTVCDSLSYPLSKIRDSTLHPPGTHTTQNLICLKRNLIIMEYESIFSIFTLFLYFAPIKYMSLQGILPETFLRPVFYVIITLHYITTGIYYHKLMS